MPRKTERVNIGDGHWAEFDEQLNTRALTIAVESIKEHDRVTNWAVREMIVASVVRWSFSETVSPGVLDYEVDATYYNDLASCVINLYLAVGGGSRAIEGEEDYGEKKD